jgi:hypothetical protein
MAGLRAFSGKQVFDAVMLEGEGWSPRASCGATSHSSCVRMSAGSFLVSDQKSRVSHPRVRHVLQGEAPKPSYVLLHFPRAVLRGVAEGNPARSLRVETY